MSNRPAATLHKEWSSIVAGGHVKLFYRDWGTGKPVVFLAGWALPSDMWSYQMVPLSQQGLRCIAFDRRGHGNSSDPGGGYDYDTLADDLASVMEALDLREVTLVAYSIGSGEAVRYLTRHGSERVARLLLLAPTATPLPAEGTRQPGWSRRLGVRTVPPRMFAPRLSQMDGRQCPSICR
jgi:pimeloyl-ACP methyl ester carboxylesterase